MRATRCGGIICLEPARVQRVDCIVWPQEGTQSKEGGAFCPERPRGTLRVNDYNRVGAAHIPDG